MIKILKILFLFLQIIFFIFVFAGLNCLLFFSQKKKARSISFAIHAFSIIAAFIMGLKIKISGFDKIKNKKGFFLVTGHLSYLDGIIASRIFPLIFVARGDLKTWPFFGVFSLISQTIFVNRSTPSGLQKEIEKISSMLKNGVNVMFFPQGTTTASPNNILFKSSFFEAPIASNSMILPFVIKYIKVNGEAVTEKNKDCIFWYGDMEFVPHLVDFLGLKTIEVEVDILEPIESFKGAGRKSLSMLSQEAIKTKLSEKQGIEEL
ncbi:MAG: lysophospholipid acyltransferase family protein [Candidatus Omnitrophica bacterium]|nr:lysophospholipid acyltransferase family protein [Candidatus Omnitrophota bacterium]